MIDWGDDNEFLKRYRLVGATELAKSYGTHRQAIYNHYYYITKYKAQLPNGRVVPKERNFPYSKYLRMLLKEIRKHAETHKNLPKCRSNALFIVWLKSKEGQRLLRHFAFPTGAAWNKDDYEFGEGL